MLVSAAPKVPETNNSNLLEYVLKLKQVKRSTRLGKRANLPLTRNILPHTVNIYRHVLKPL